MTDAPTPPITTVSADELQAKLPELGQLLHACVLDGASVNFVLPFSTDAAEAFWIARVLPGLQSGTRLLLVTEIDGRIAGSVQLDYATPPNQPHRADVAKLLVHPDFRRRGLARALMTELERHALALGRTLLTLDTLTGDKAEPLYASMGYHTVGVIPGYCLHTVEDRLESTTLMYKTL